MLRFSQMLHMETQKSLVILIIPRVLIIWLLLNTAALASGSMADSGFITSEAAFHPINPVLNTKRVKNAKKR